MIYLSIYTIIFEVIFCIRDFTLKVRVVKANDLMKILYIFYDITKNEIYTNNIRFICYINKYFFKK